MYICFISVLLDVTERTITLSTICSTLKAFEVLTTICRTNKGSLLWGNSLLE